MHALRPPVPPRTAWSRPESRSLLLALLLALLLGLPLPACGGHPEEEGPRFGPWQAPAGEIVYEVPPPPFRGDGEIGPEDIYPCTNCHEAGDVNRERRALTQAHQGIALHHDEKNRWCLDCHDAENRDRLRLASGVEVPFEESYRLCGQCHGDKYRDWRAGAHGRRVGQWNGAKKYLLCVNCHDSHSPRFAPLVPEPPPVRPEAGR